MSGTGVDPRVALGPVLAPGTGVPVLEALDHLRPVVRAPANASEPAALAAATLYSLLMRVHAHTCLEGDAAMGPNPWGIARLSELPAALTASRPGAAADATRDLVIAVGPAKRDAHLWIGGDNWTARVGRGPQPVSGQSALGLQASAIFAAAEALKVALGSRMMHVPVGDELVWNVWDYRNRPAPDVGAASGRLDGVVFFGSGSVGSSAAGLLMAQKGVTGNASVVDPDPFDPGRNPFRYPSSTGQEAGPKAEWAAGLLEAAGWAAQAYPAEVANWVQSQERPGIVGLVVSSVDTVSGRLQVADAIAATTLSVGVLGTALHIQREHCFDDLACPYCDFVKAATPLSQAHVHAQMTGLSLHRILQLNLDDDTLSAEDVAEAVNAGKLHPDRAPGIVGHRLADLVQGIYAQAVVADVGQPDPATVMAVSTPFVSWMGGLLIVAELAKAAMGAPLVNRRADLELSGLPIGAVSRRLRDTTGYCTCHSPYRRRWAARLYGSDRAP